MKNVWGSNLLSQGVDFRPSVVNFRTLIVSFRKSKINFRNSRLQGGPSREYLMDPKSSINLYTSLFTQSVCLCKWFSIPSDEKNKGYRCSEGGAGPQIVSQLYALKEPRGQAVFFCDVKKMGAP